MNKKRISEMARNNKFAMIGHGVNALIVCAMCILQAVELKREPWHIAVALALGFIPVIGEVVFWLKNKETTMIKHFVGYGYALFYTFFLFTSANHMFFLMVIPMVLVISVYNDIAYSIKINAGLIIENIIAVAIWVNKDKFACEDINSAVVQILIIVMIAVYSVITSAVLNSNSTDKINDIKEKQNQVEDMLAHISLIAKETKSGVINMNKILGNLCESSCETKENMTLVTMGVKDTAEAVQEQLVQTEAIQQKVDSTDEVASFITESMSQNLEVLETGKRDVAVLVEQVEDSVKNGTEVADKLNNLDVYIKEMNSIVELISGITSQTSLLSLNASIEAARAGEAGKGFAVVASEISNMATQTKDATVHITELIGNISNAITEVVEVIYQMIEGINEEKQTTINTADSFENIQKTTVAVQENIIKLASDIKELKAANKVIVESVQRISGVSEEVYASADKTLHGEEANAEMLDEIYITLQKVLALTKNE